MTMQDEQIIYNEVISLLNFHRNTFSKKYKCCLPIQLLRHTITCYVQDLNRLSIFHHIDCPDRHKQSAHLIYWIAKIKPIHIIDGIGNFDKPSAPFINEIFAYYTGLSRLNINISSLSNSFLINFLYNLHFRDIKPESLYLLLYSLEQSANKKTP